MTDQQFVELCLRVCHEAQGQLPPALGSRLKTDTGRRKDKGPQAMLFSVRDKKRNSLWNGYYTSYQLVHNPFKGVGGIWHCRFLHHKKRQETGSGQFNGGLGRLLRRYDGQGGFHLEGNDEVDNLTQPFKGTEPGLETKLARALAFLIGHLHPGIDEVIAGTHKPVVTGQEKRDGDLPVEVPAHEPGKARQYWIVSPNVKNDEATVEDWCAASIREQVAFMGWAPHDKGHGGMGPKFAGRSEPGILPGDMVLIARRHQGKPHLVGFGVVEGGPLTSLKNFTPPKGQPFGSFRRLSPFVPWSHEPSGIPLRETLTYTMAMVQLHPAGREVHQQVCDWMEHHIHRTGENGSTHSPTILKGNDNAPNISLIDPPEAHQLDFKVQSQAQVITAQAAEAKLLIAYRVWLEKQDRKLVAAKYGKLWCDGYEEATGNLVEAKSSATREHIRMAVGQLLDYAFAGKAKFGEQKKAILLPTRPEASVEAWLSSLDISVIWQEGKLFFDNAARRFT